MMVTLENAYRRRRRGHPPIVSALPYRSHSSMPRPTPRLLSPLDLLREWRVIGDAVAAYRHRSLPNYPHGHESVMVIPGFGAGDSATAILRQRLTRLGHQVTGWGLGINRGRVEVDTARLLPRLDRLFHDGDERPVTLIGWSLGGVIARELARRRPPAVREIIALGAPLIGGPKYTFTARWYARQGLDLDRLERKAAEREASSPLSCPMISLYSRNDGMVHFGASVAPEAVSEAIEVSSSHLGMCLSPQVLRIVAQRLAS